MTHPFYYKFILFVQTFAYLLAGNMQGFVIKTDNEYIDIEQRDKYLDSKDADSKPVD